MPIKMLELKLKSLVEQTLQPLQALAEQKKQMLTIKIPVHIEVFTDENQMPRALKNIIHNAIKFTPEGGKSDITATVAEDEVILQVKDSGGGLNSHDLG